MSKNKAQARATLTYIMADLINQFADYKPGYEIRAEPGPLGGTVLVQVIANNIPNSRKIGDTTTVYNSDEIDVANAAMMSTEELVRYVQSQLKNLFINMELHEIDEWFRWDGGIVRDPHQRYQSG